MKKNLVTLYAFNPKKTLICSLNLFFLKVGIIFFQFDNLPFTSNDENFVEAFAIFCGMGINNVKMYETAVLAMAKQQVKKCVLTR